MTPMIQKMLYAILRSTKMLQDDYARPPRPDLRTRRQSTTGLATTRSGHRHRFDASYGGTVRRPIRNICSPAVGRYVAGAALRCSGK